MDDTCLECFAEIGLAVPPEAKTFDWFLPPFSDDGETALYDAMKNSNFVFN